MAVELGTMGGALQAPRRRANYNAAEARFSSVLHERIRGVLEGKSNRLDLVRQYHGQTDRLGVLATPPGLPRQELRLPVVRALVGEAISFFCPEGAGGVVAQRAAADGSTLEVQSFATRYPHIVIERTDRYLPDSMDAADTTWALQRVQNQREQTQINRLLDVTNLIVSVLTDLPFLPRP